MFSASHLHALDFAGIEKNIGLEFRPKYNRSFYYSWDIAAFGEVAFEETWFFKSGIAIGQAWDALTLAAYTSAEYAFPFWRNYIPMSVSAAYNYNRLPGLPPFVTHTHTLLPLFSLKWRYGGASAGYILRWSRFDKTHPALFEPILAFSLFVNAITTDAAAVTMRISNFDDFSARNLTAYSFYIENKLRITKYFRITSNLQIAFSGNVAKLISVYGISFTEGVVFTW